MKNNQLNPIFFSLLLLISCHLNTAAQIGTWKSYRAYNEATIAVATPNLVFAVYDGSLLSYSPEDQEIRTYSLENGLHDIDIRHLNYSPEAHALFIVYENSNIDIFLGENEVYNLADIKDKNIPNKIVNHVVIIGEYAYLATGYGIEMVDIKRKEIKNTYRLGVNTTAICQWNGYWYAATSDGLRRATLSSNLLDKENWEYLPPLAGVLNKTITRMALFKDHLVFYDTKSTFSLSKGGELKLLFTGLCRQLAIIDNQLALAVWNAVYFYDDLNTGYTELRLTEFYRSIHPAYNSKEDYWIAWGTKGLVEIKVTKEGNKLTYDPPAAGIKVNSPFRNLTYGLTFSEGKLLVTGGGRTSYRYESPGTFMLYENNRWYNYDDQAISAQTGVPCLDLMSSVVDPLDPTHYYVSSWGEGVYEFKDTVLVTLHTYNNSSLQNALPNYLGRFVRTDGMVFDRNHNFYVVNAEVEKGLSIMKNNKEWVALSYLSNAQVNHLIITRDNRIWGNLFSESATGIFVLNNNNTVDDQADDTYYSGRSFVDQQGTDIKNPTFLCLAEDRDGIVWVGTDKGPISFLADTWVKDGVCNRVISTDQYGNGYYLLDGEKVNTIAVDGGNRKWMGTEGSGVFIVDQSDGTLKVENLNTSNSFLISDNVNSIAINDQTGEVFIATDRGLCSYRGEAIEGKANYSNVYAYPNPVYPARQHQVVITGLMADSRVKITDVSGNLIKEATSNGGQYAWNCANLHGEIVKAGIYLVFATLPNGSQGVVTKIMVIK
ncbi:MAG: hypothetical protein LBO74_10145 [Candidatus Symbiothrix sp.]|jgi:hypothetical protein|nr:hypothetical protein [Candidatus Symbiothrix sp.]